MYLLVIFLINLEILTRLALPATQGTMLYYYPNCTYGDTEVQGD